MKILYFGKICSKCKTYKKRGCFYKDKSKRFEISSRCKECIKKYSVRPKNHKETIRERSKRWRKDNKELYTNAVTNSTLKKKYGITLDDYNLMYKEQKGVCAICDLEELSGKRLAVDHCHETGKVRGLLCFACNTSLGKFNDSISTLESAINYLKNYEK